MQSRHWIIQLTALLVSVLSLTSAQAETQWGTLRGRVIYDGEPPPEKLFELSRKSRDAHCFPDGVLNEELLVNGENKGLANVFVYLISDQEQPIEVHPSYAKSATADVPLLMEKGRFEPHAVLLRSPQTLVVTNKDKCGHYVTFFGVNNHPYGITVNDSPTQKHNLVEERFPLKRWCSIHPWMSVCVLIRDSPYMAITDADGRFEIQNLPVGKHRFKFWHERAGYVRVKEGSDFQLQPRGILEVTLKSDNNSIGTGKVDPIVFEVKR